jgi:predicted enzyme related to lactoylglutathione lyase
MKTVVAFFEIPAINFGRAVTFYETILGIKLSVMDCGHEKMAFFLEENGLCPGAISWAAENSFLPSENGVLVSLNVENMEQATDSIKENGGKVLIPKTKIEADNRGYFCTFIDCEGNRVGLYSNK